MRIALHHRAGLPAAGPLQSWVGVPAWRYQVANVCRRSCERKSVISARSGAFLQASVLSWMMGSPRKVKTPVQGLRLVRKVLPAAIRGLVDRRATLECLGSRRASRGSERPEARETFLVEPVPRLAIGLRGRNAGRRWIAGADGGLAGTQDGAAPELVFDLFNAARAWAARRSSSVGTGASGATGFATSRYFSGTTSA